MGRVLRIINGIPRQVDESGGSSVTIYDESLTVVSGTPGAGEIQGPISAGTPITLPDSQTYTSEELEVRLNNIRGDVVSDYNYEGSGDRTQISFTFEVVVGDIIRFRIDRAA